MITIKCPDCKHETILYSTEDAANYLGPIFGWKDPLTALKYHIHKAHNIEGQLIGHTLMFTQEALDEFKATKRPRGRPRKGDDTNGKLG